MLHFAVLSDFHNMYFVSIVLYDPDQILCFQPYCSRVIIRMYTNQTGTLFECLINIEYNFLLRIIEQAIADTGESKSVTKIFPITFWRQEYINVSFQPSKR